jgi:hypothetical protein
LGTFRAVWRQQRFPTPGAGHVEGSPDATRLGIALGHARFIEGNEREISDQAVLSRRLNRARYDVSVLVALELWEAHDFGREDSGLFQHPRGLVRHTGTPTHPTLAWLEWRQLAAPATRNFFHLLIASALGPGSLLDCYALRSAGSILSASDHTTTPRGITPRGSGQNFGGGSGKMSRARLGGSAAGVAEGCELVGGGGVDRALRPHPLRVHLQAWTAPPQRFKITPLQKMSGLNI